MVGVDLNVCNLNTLFVLGSWLVVLLFMPPLVTLLLVFRQHSNLCLSLDRKISKIQQITLHYRKNTLFLMIPSWNACVDLVLFHSQIPTIQYQRINFYYPVITINFPPYSRVQTFHKLSYDFHFNVNFKSHTWRIPPIVFKNFQKQW